MLVLDADFFREVLDGLQTGVYAVDPGGKILFWNAGAERITGYLRQEMMGRTSSDNFLGLADSDGNELNGAVSPLAIAIRDGKPINAQVSLRHKEGHNVPVDLYSFAIRGSNNSVIAAVESFQESVAVAEWDRRQGKLASYGCLDPASGVLTHGVIQSHLRELLGTFAEHPVPFSILCMEIDTLEKIQARDGPGAVASVLRIVGQTLENSLRPTDFVGRWQGNQFLAILLECSIGELPRAADRLRRMISSSKVTWWGDPLPISASLGGASVQHGDTVETLVLRAEEALRASLVQGGACVSVRGN